MKSFFRAVKCFFLSDPFAPQVDLCCPSLRGVAKVHERCNGSRRKKHFRRGEMISWGKPFTSWEWDFVQWEPELRIFWVFFHVGKMISRLYLATAWEKNHFSFTSEGKIIFLSQVKEKNEEKSFFFTSERKMIFLSRRC